MNEYSTHPLRELFAGTELDWSGQLVKLVFHYDEKRFVVMTATNLFVFEYARFRVGPGNRLMHSYNETDEPIKKRNCLLPQNCPDSLSRPSNKFVRRVVARSTITLLVVAIVIIFVLLIWTFRLDSRKERSERAQYILNVVSNLSKSFRLVLTRNRSFDFDRN